MVRFFLESTYMTADGSPPDGTTQVRFTQMERVVLALSGTVLISILGWIGSTTWQTYQTVSKLAIQHEFVSKILDDHEVRIRNIELGKLNK